MAPGLEQALERELAGWEQAGRQRSLTERDRVPAAVDFCSNDYLGLARHPLLVEAAREALAEHGVGGRASRLLGGGSPWHGRLEQLAADWLGAQAALLFPSGYQANLGLVGALVGRGDAIFSDELNHASLVDAARLSRARIHVHRHLDLAQLERNLRRAGKGGRRLVLCEGVYSMDGDASPLEELYRLCERHDAWLVVDEAHSAGLLGPEGAGAWAELGRSAADSDRLAARVVTGGKALGAGGALVAGSARLRDLLLHRARSFIYTTAPGPATAAALHRAIEIVRADDELRARPTELARRLARGLELPTPAAAIVACVIGDEREAVECAADMLARGFEGRAVRPPTVPPGTSRVRLTCHAYNTPAEVDFLIEGCGTALTSSPSRGAKGAGKPLGPATFVLGTDTGVGKTVVSALLLRAARRLGPARYWKPVQTGTESDTAEVARLAGLRPAELLPPVYELELPASPHEAAAAQQMELRPEFLPRSLLGLRRTLFDEHLLVELAGGLLVPYTLGETQADWLERERPTTVLVARSGLGTLNHTLLTLEALRARHLEPSALFLVGEPHASNRETLARMGAPERVFELPGFEPLDTEALDRWLDDNDLSALFGDRP